MTEDKILDDLIDDVMNNARSAFVFISKTNHLQRAKFLRNIALEIENIGDILLEIASSETNLPLPRLQGERVRTCNQLRMFASFIEKGDFLRVSIDHAQPDRTPLPKADIRRMVKGVGPVIVFGASNFPLAFSTAGGDTASALAAGCSVVVKSHPGHPKTSEMVANAIKKAVSESGMPLHTFQHIDDSSFRAGALLVKHSETKAVGFTGSHSGGMAIHRYASERSEPIPVFAEMGSINPVFLLPQMLMQNTDQLARKYAASITLGSGQFCTKPGVIFGINSPYWERFVEILKTYIDEMSEMAMLNTGIKNSFREKIKERDDCDMLTKLTGMIAHEDLQPGFLYHTDSESFFSNPLLKEEVFGPCALLVSCRDIADYKKMISILPGQLTVSFAVDEQDLKNSDIIELVEMAQQKAGRVICNDMPTGVEVCESIIHGGPYPATTDSRFTSVGTESIYRWLRPVCFQNFPENLLPDELKSSNPLNITQNYTR